MIESGYIKRNKGSCQQADLRYEMRFMDEDNLDEMMNLQEIVVHHLADKEIFRTHSADYFQEHLQIEKSAIGVFCQDGLIAYNILSFPGDSKDNFGHDINLPKGDLPNVVHLATIAVHPDFRGNSLQSKMQNAHLKLIANLGYEHVCCMVSPKNRPSLQNILSQGLIIKALKIKFQWRLRYIMHKNLLNPCLIGPDVVRMDSKDIPGQINLLDRGFQGFHLSKLSDSFEIHYAKPT
jgi:ribosomal protein S18 acetylase RimI-like enzyme